MSAATSIVYRAIDGAPGRYFTCDRLRAKLRDSTCGQRWSVAPPGSACKDCMIGRQHHTEAGGVTQAATVTPFHAVRPSQHSSCLRCGRTDMRILRTAGICVGCHARQGEWQKGWNSKGKAPATFIPLQTRSVATRAPDGSVTHHLVGVQHAAEAVGLVARRHLPAGHVFTAERLGRSLWDADGQRFTFVDRESDQPFWERRRRVRGISSQPAHGGGPDHTTWTQLEIVASTLAPEGEGWQRAVERQPVEITPAAALAAWLDLTADHKIAPAWVVTPSVCGACRAAPLEARRMDQGRGWEVRCGGCGAAHG